MTDRLAVADLMVATLAAEIRDGDLVGVGLGTPLAVAAALLARATTAPDAHVLVAGAVDPVADLSTCLAGPAALAGHTTGWVPHLDTMGMAESQAMTLQFLRPAQVDGRGACNTSSVGPRPRSEVGAGPGVGTGDRRVRLPGGLATADVPSLLPRLVVYLPHHRARALPDRVAVVTGAVLADAAAAIPAATPADEEADGEATDHDGPGPSRGVVRIVTDLAVLVPGHDGARLESVHPGVDLDEVVARTGFALHDVDGAGVTATPSVELTRALQHIDPDGVRAGELA